MRAALLAAAITLALTPVAPAGVPIVAAADGLSSGAAAMSFWIVVLVVGAATIAFKASGPVLLGDRPLGPRLQSIVDLLAPVMLTALVVTQTFAGDQEIVLDARVPGVAAAAVAVWRGASVIAAMVIAGLVTALIRAFLG